MYNAYEIRIIWNSLPDFVEFEYESNNGKTILMSFCELYLLSKILNCLNANSCVDKSFNFDRNSFTFDFKFDGCCSLEIIFPNDSV